MTLPKAVKAALLDERTINRLLNDAYTALAPLQKCRECGGFIDAESERRGLNRIYELEERIAELEELKDQIAEREFMRTKLAMSDQEPAWAQS